MIAVKYYRHECGWTGTEDDMKADSIPGGVECDEVWSNWICPNCGMWCILEDYKEADVNDR